MAWPTPSSSCRTKPRPPISHTPNGWRSSHGLVKLFGFPPGAAPGQQELLSVMGIGAVIETVAGTLIALGLFTRAAAFIASGEMAVGYWMFHAPQSMYPAVNGGDAAILFCFVFLYLVAAGAGAFSLERRNSPHLISPSCRPDLRLKLR